MTAEAYFRGVLARGSRSFRLASRLLPRDCRADAAVLYAWCRRADDAVDERPAGERAAALAALRAELDDIYHGGTPAEATAAAFADVVRRRRIPRAYPDELLAGMAMDVAGARYDALPALLLYCYRVAGVVGLMMCHVMGVGDPAALRRAAHLGIGMQLTNICRDVDEDGRRGRVYLPASFLDGGVRAAIARLLAEADRYYASGDAGLPDLRWRCALAVRTARLVYHAIGARIAARGHDVSTRAVVPARTKLRLLVVALGRGLAELPRRLAGRFRPAPLLPPVRYPDDVLPV